jgi:BirA family biotin operon repressor/biotin-[acetyl-CoA-carboxylase] ligase
MKETPFVKKTEEFSKNLHLDFVKKFYVFDTLDSTNSTAKELAVAGADEGTVVVARVQKQGRGRYDRLWQSPEGGVYLSLTLRPNISPENLSLLPFVAGLAVAKTMDSFGLRTIIKWPNDILVNGKKIAGILLESEVEGSTVKYVIVGIGMNLNIKMNVLSSDIQPRSTSMMHEKGSPVDYHEFLRSFLIQFEADYSLLTNHQYERIITEWKNHSDTLGKTVRVQTSTEVIQGVACGIDPSGFLLIRTDNGRIKKIYSGDCVYFTDLHHA